MSARALDALVDALRRLPGVGVRSAQRMAAQLLQHDREAAAQLALALQHALAQVRHCARCHTFSEDEVCATCLDPQRDDSQLCVVETPADQAAVERTGSFRGRYYVLMGRLSPIDGMTPASIGIPLLEQRLREGEVAELIVATGTTMEGEATAHYLREIAAEHGVRATRIAHGVPIGGELEFVDSSTLSRALASRHEY